MDVNAIQPGRDFRKAIDESIHKCSVLLAIVGLGWLESKDGSGQKRLEDANDFVRLEIASALERDIRGRSGSGSRGQDAKGRPVPDRPEGAGFSEMRWS